ncbi:hypothetical protein Acr_00g0075570 [Actinidia rufa]|uniref:Reverse transcriptase domain-containing protein n=1 Tax=Actinidia rufa TaxID=165716 RepID=A0A7J0DSV5_9ERIC|nr:hypothetical protein Acr_00g0075570 [Actinidia rufa]
MHLRSRYLPRPSASSPPDNRAHPMANPGQIPDLEGLHREIHGMAEQIRIMNKNNSHLMQLLVATNLPHPAAPVPDIVRSRHSNHSEDRSQNISIEQVRGRHRAPSPSLRERSSSSKSSKMPTRARRGRSPHRGDYIEARNKGYLRKYVITRPPPNSPERRYGDNRPTAGDIQTIHGGFGSGGCSTSSRKKHAKSAFRLAEEEIYNLSSSSVGDQTPITFSNDDLRGLHLPHDDALVVSAVIANFNVQRILIDNGSSADILFISAFERMKIGQDKLHPFHTPLIGFGGNTTHPLGWINLPITLGTEPHQTTIWNQGDQLDLSPEGDDIGVLRDEVEQLTLADPRETDNTKPLEKVVPISIHPNYSDRHIMISTELTDELRSTLIDFWKKNSDIFAWSQGDVPGIDPEIAMHKLFTNPKYSPIRQKRRKFAPERLKVIEDEVSKLIRANVVREAHYPDWLANVVVAPKKGGKWRVYVDFTDLNKACPKDSFPLPKIDLIVDATSKHELLSFMDAFSGYHQIKMYPPDTEKTSFITERGC